MDGGTGGGGSLTAYNFVNSAVGYASAAVGPYNNPGPTYTMMDNETLTIVQFHQPKGAVDYVNSMWEIQKEPYAGDAANSYNDGPPEAGKPPLGPFFELETSSPALDLLPVQRYTHVHRTFHLVGPEAELDRIARATIRVGLEELTNAFSPQR